MSDAVDAQPVVIVPARNAANTIGTTLTSLQTSQGPLPYTVLVVANGCSDRTSDIARDFGVEVTELAEPGKAAAINHGLALKPKVAFAVVDADVTVSPGSVSRCFEWLQRGEGITICAPRIKLEPSQEASPFVKAFVRYWSKADYFGEGLVGAGFYAVSADSRDRIEPLPAEAADDLYVSWRFAPHERGTLKSDWFRPSLATSFLELVAQEHRRERARRSFLAGLTHDASSIARSSNSARTARAIRDPAGAAAFVVVRLLSRLSRGPSSPSWLPRHDG